jgi:catalase (peroxidase I)
MAPTAGDTKKAALMTTADIFFKVDLEYQKISKKFPRGSQGF